MDKETEIIWTEDMGFMPPIVKTEGRTICREECQLTEYKQEIERLREALKDLLDATDQWVFQESYPLAVKKAKAALKEGE